MLALVACHRADDDSGQTITPDSCPQGTFGSGSGLCDWLELRGTDCGADCIVVACGSVYSDTACQAQIEEYRYVNTTRAAVDEAHSICDDERSFWEESETECDGAPWSTLVWCDLGCM